MKGQDIGVLLKLVCLQRHQSFVKAMATWPHDWKDWQSLEEDPLGATAEELDPNVRIISLSRYTARSLKMQAGISKTQINRSLKHCMDIGPARNDRKLNVPRANTNALMEFIVYGLKYVFPTRPGELTRGIATSFAAPVLANQLLSAGEHLLVWSYARGKTMGMKGEPLFKSAPDAAACHARRYSLIRSESFLLLSAASPAPGDVLLPAPVLAD